MTAVLVTGATGPLGRTVVAQMNNLGNYKVITAGRNLSAGQDSIRCDISDRAQIEAAVAHARPDLILHLAAVTVAGDLDAAYAVNVAPAQHILEFVQRSGLGTRVVLIGSAAEYGVVLPEENPVREDRILRPVSVYGVSKAWQTLLVGLYSGRGLDVLCARIFNLWGPGLSDRLFAGKLQNQIDEVVAKRKSVIELGSLAAIRDYVPVEEAAAQLLSIANYGNSGETYHIATGVPVMMRELTIRALAAHNLDFSIVQESPNLSNRIGYDVPVIYASMDKTSKLRRCTTSDTPH